MAKRNKKAIASSSTKHQKASEFLSNRNIGVIFTRDLGHAEILNLSTLAHMKTSKGIKEIAQTITEYEHFWFYKLFVLCRDPQGKMYIEFADATIKSSLTQKRIRVKQKDISEHLNCAHHAYLSKMVNNYHAVNTGWLALPYHPDSNYNPEELIDKYCDIYDCWNYKSKYDAEKDQTSNS